MFNTLRVNLLCLLSLGLVGFMGTTPVRAETGDLKIRFEYGGAAVTPGNVNVTTDKAFCGANPIIDDRLLVNKDNKGIKDVIVYVYTGRGGTDLPEMPAAKTVHTLANLNCRFEPHVVIMHAGDTLDVTNPDAVGHNANLQFFNNKSQNLTIPPGQKVSVELPLGEVAPMPVVCNIHPWMKARVLVLDHPFAAKSDEDGVLTIKGLPAGEEVVFRVSHDAGSIKEVVVDGKKTEWKRSRFEVKIKPGMNDLGTVVIPADALKAD